MNFLEIKRMENIATEYFEILEEYFRGIYQPGLDKYLMAEKISHMDIAIKTIILSLNDLEEDLNKLWDKYGESLIEISKDPNTFKVLYCGNPSPLNGITFVKRTALYLDSLFIEDPIMFLLKTKKVATDRAYLNQMIKHAFNLLDLKKLFYGEGSVPLLIIFPPFTNDESRSKINGIINQSGDEYFKLLFERDFMNTEDVFDFLNNITSVNNLMLKVQNSNFFFPDTTDKPERVFSLYTDIKESWKNNNNITVGTALGYKIYGQFSNIGTQVFQAQRLSSQIVFDRREYWDLYKWDLSQKKGVTFDIEHILLNSMQLDDFKWLENIDIDKLNIARNEEEILKLRSVIRKNIHTTIGEFNEEKVARQAVRNLEEALVEHSKKVTDYSKQLKRKLGIDSIIVAGGTIASIPATFGLSSVIGGLSAIYGIWDYASSTAKIHKERERLNNSMMGVLFDAREQRIRD
ncbi:hypothetical protein [Alkalihalobacillus sp. BA299]|uniref:hypothetical protein n=1 Tax=Alkalihalobacillus sp. BA299 TaxID=2815938 RepID=UPI001ADC6254|nr:hypothetical protein [Alkalihalobacillus sp. BA299]